jgi:uncharacterized protein
LVRALAWSCFSEPLINEISGPNGVVSHPNLPLTPERQNWLYELDQDDQPLRDYLHKYCHSTRLGLVFESLWHFFLQQDKQTELIAHNIPVRRDKITLGEFDLIYYCRNREKHIHLELAVKFFLGIPNALTAPNLDQWFGPNRADRLDRKLARLTQHQLPLIHTDAGRAVVAELGIGDIEQELLVNGILFHPLTNETDYPTLNRSHQRGDWCSISHFQEEQEASREQYTSWRYIEKPCWLGANFISATPLSSKHMKMAEQKPIMLINAQHERRFLVADDWAD